MERVQTELQTELHFTKDMIKRIMKYAGHVLIGSSCFFTFTDSRGNGGGKKESGLSYKNMDKGYLLMDRFGYV